MSTPSPHQLESLLGPAIESLGLGIVLWGIEFQAGDHRALLRIYVDAPGRHVGIEDCEAASREVSALLDVHDPIPGNYVLEVSSPGFDRPLFTREHFAAFVGDTAKVTLVAPQSGRRRAHGRIVRVEDDQVVFDVDGVEMVFSIANIQKARLATPYVAPAKPVAKGPRRKPGSEDDPSPSEGTA